VIEESLKNVHKEISDLSGFLFQNLDKNTFLKGIENAIKNNV